MKKTLIAAAASLAMAATFTATAPVAASAAGNDHVEMCRPLVDAQIFGSLGECVSLIRTAPVQLCKDLKDFGLLDLFGWRNLGQCVSDLRALN